MLDVGYPELWALGGAVLFWPLMAILSAAYLLKTRLTGLAALSLAVAVVLGLSSVLGTIMFGLQIDRLLGLVANITVWIGLAGLLVLASRRDLSRELSRALAVVCLAQGAVILLAWALMPQPLPIPLTAGLAESLPDSVRAFSTSNIVYVDWLGGEELRSIGLMGNPTWAGAFAAVALVVVVPLVREPGRWRLLGWLAIAAAGLGIAFSLSRSTIAALVVSVGLGALQLVRRRSTVAFFTLSLIAPLLAAGYVLSQWATVVGWIDETNATRAGSLDSRSDIYRETFRLVGELPFPLLGYGIKPHDPDLVSSIATHSTYLGMLFRGGFLGLLAVLALLIGVMIQAYRAGSATAAAITSFTAIWCLLEDFDPGHLLPLGLVYAVTLVRAASTEASLVGRGRSKHPPVRPVRPGLLESLPVEAPSVLPARLPISGGPGEAGRGSGQPSC